MGGPLGMRMVAKHTKAPSRNDQARRRMMGRLQSAPSPMAATDTISCALTPAAMSLSVTPELVTTTGAIIPRMPIVAATTKANSSFESGPWSGCPHTTR